MAVLGKALSEASCANLYLYTTELYPTVVRWAKHGASAVPKATFAILKVDLIVLTGKMV